MTSREQLASVYQDTINKSKNRSYPRSYSTTFRHDPSINMSRKFNKTTVTVVNEDVLLTAERYSNDRTITLNLASDYCPGGGVFKGSMAQEEEIFRRSNYFLCTNRNLYPIIKTNVIYTPNVTIFKDSNYKDLEVPFTSSFIAAAAIRSPILNNGRYNTTDYQTMLMTIDTIFRTSYQLGYDTLILGALGCGAFRNPPNIIISIFNKFLREYNGCFKNVIFSVYSRRDDNFRIFNNGIVRL